MENEEVFSCIPLKLLFEFLNLFLCHKISFCTLCCVFPWLGVLELSLNNFWHYMGFIFSATSAIPISCCLEYYCCVWVPQSEAIFFVLYGHNWLYLAYPTSGVGIIAWTCCCVPFDWSLKVERNCNQLLQVCFFLTQPHNIASQSLIYI